MKNPVSCQDQEAFLDSIIADCNDKPPALGQPRFHSFGSFSARQQLLIFQKVFLKIWPIAFFTQRTICEGNDAVIVELHPPKTDDFGCYIYGSSTKFRDFIKPQGQVGIGKVEAFDRPSIHSTEWTFRKSELP